MTRDRYAIYDLLGKAVKFKLPPRLGGKIVSGVIDRIYRDPLNKTIEFRLGSRKQVLREPFAIEREDENTISFIYGDDSPVTDDELLAEVQAQTHKGKGIETAFRATDRHEYRIKFVISQVVVKQRHRRNKRGRKKKK